MRQFAFATLGSHRSSYSTRGHMPEVKYVHELHTEWIRCARVIVGAVSRMHDQTVLHDHTVELLRHHMNRNVWIVANANDSKPNAFNMHFSAVISILFIYHRWPLCSLLRCMGHWRVGASHAQKKVPKIEWCLVLCLYYYFNLWTAKKCHTSGS